MASKTAIGGTLDTSGDTPTFAECNSRLILNKADGTMFIGNGKDVFFFKGTQIAG